MARRADAKEVSAVWNARDFKAAKAVGSREEAPGV
jgi:hypothetical protein